MHVCECEQRDRVYLYQFNISIKLAPFHYEIVLIDLLIMQTMQMDGFLMLTFEWFLPSSPEIADRRPSSLPFTAAPHEQQGA